MPTYIGLSIMIKEGAQIILYPLWMLQALPLNCFNHANLKIAIRELSLSSIHSGC
jgi:hypothetical protein